MSPWSAKCKFKDGIQRLAGSSPFFLLPRVLIHSKDLPEPARQEKGRRKLLGQWELPLQPDEMLVCKAGQWADYSCLLLPLSLSFSELQPMSKLSSLCREGYAMRQRSKVPRLQAKCHLPASRCVCRICTKEPWKSRATMNGLFSSPLWNCRG